MSSELRKGIVSELYEMYQAGIDHNQVPSKYGPVTEEDKQEATDRILALVRAAMLSEAAVEAGAKGVYSVYPDWLALDEHGMTNRKLPWDESCFDSKRGKRRASTAAIKSALTTALGDDTATEGGEG